MPAKRAAKAGGQELGHTVIPLGTKGVALFWVIFMAYFAHGTHRCLGGV